MTVLQNERFRAEMDPDRGARLVSLRIDGHEVLGGADPGTSDASIGSGCYPMVPWAGRLSGHDIHGPGRDATWVDHGDGEFSIELTDAAGEPGVATLGYLLLDHGLEMTLAWHGAPDGWSSLGFHPWFRRQLHVGDPVQVDIEPTSMVERGADHLPTGALVEPGAGPWDDCFRLASPPRLTWPGALSLDLVSDAGWWVVFDASRDAVCIEPQTAPPDAIHHRTLQPAGGWAPSVSLRISVRLGD